MKSNFHLLFYLRKQKNYKSGPIAIYMRITVNGKRADMSVGSRFYDNPGSDWTSFKGVITLFGNGNVPLGQFTWGFIQGVNGYQSIYPNGYIYKAQ